jgi:hypothetical protein
MDADGDGSNGGECVLPDSAEDAFLKTMVYKNDRE